MARGGQDVSALFTQYGRVLRLVFTDALRQHLAQRGIHRKHRVLIAEIIQVHTGRPRFLLSTSVVGRAPIIMVGPTAADRFLVVPLVPTNRQGDWEPVTAYEANRHHLARYHGRQQ
jgi:hypothetical protein